MLRETREQRCWFHKSANVFAALPKSAHPGAKKTLAEIWGAESMRHVLKAVKAFDAGFDAEFPKAVAKITNDIEELLAFYDYPAEHWVHSLFVSYRVTDQVSRGHSRTGVSIAMVTCIAGKWMVYLTCGPRRYRAGVRAR